MKRILYIGIFSGPNLGDLVISNEIHRYLKSKDDVLVEAMDFVTLKKISNVDVNISIKSGCSTIQRFKNIMSDCDILRYTNFKYREFTASCGASARYTEYKNIINEFDIICIGGGNLMMSTTNNYWAININKLIKIANAKNKKVYIMSIGVGQILLSKSKKLFEESIEIVDGITVRDEYSRRLIMNDLNIDKEVGVTGDPALLLKDYGIKVNKNERDSVNIAISVMPFGGTKSLSPPSYKNYNYYKEMYKKLIEYFCKMDSNYTINLFSTVSYDYDSIADIHRYILSNSKYVTDKNLKIVHITSLDELLMFYSNQNLLIGTRMHSLIIAYTQSLPIIAISWQKKVDEFMEYIDSIHFCYQLNSVDANITEIYADAYHKLKCEMQNNKNELFRMGETFDNITSRCIKC